MTGIHIYVPKCSYIDAMRIILSCRIVGHVGSDERAFVCENDANVEDEKYV